MKIGIIADALDTQGAGIHRYTKCLLDAMHKLNTEHTFHIIRASNKKDYPKWNEHIFPIKPLPLNLRLRQLTVIPKKLNKLKPDIVLETAHFGPFRLDPNIKRVTMVHDVTPLTHAQFHPFSSYFAHKLFLNAILNKADRIITNSKNTTRDLNKLFPYTISKTFTIPLAANKAKKITDCINITLPKKFILTVGTVEPRKNLRFLIKAFEKIDDEELHLIIAGKIGWKSKKIIQAAETSIKKKQITVMGFVDDNILETLYEKALLFVYPSHYEGFGLPVLEAMQRGTPVLCSNYSSLPEVGGDAVEYITSTSIDKFVEQLRNISSDFELLKELSDAGRRQSKKFSWERTAKQTLKQLELTCE